MKIAVLDFNTNSVDVISVDDEAHGIRFLRHIMLGMAVWTNGWRMTSETNCPSGMKMTNGQKLIKTRNFISFSLITAATPMEASNICVTAKRFNI